ncbi:MAG: 16S rRNA (adenine(1518)-N(6)/adenine(1519)-N(6))-dimethyltransferase RsmA [Elusimicrobia bacterium]|nr:16S rRNA (adenine(1518)-N(6)/adenine(1519)-N(6))-dimethyltransferase RsmA [Candidatus Obscuribacterium magneticum]
MSPRYAQHFLTNKHAVDRIIESLRLTGQETVLEIGPGKGVLTAQLVKRARKVIAIEIDQKLLGYLQKKLGSCPNLQLINGDILEVDLKDLINSSIVVGNLPYNLTSPILRRLSEWNGWTEAFLTVQKEVGDRLCAKVGTPDYGALTVGMNLTCEMAPVFVLSEKSFDPPPKVKSMVVKFIRRENHLTTDIAFTQRIIQAAFQQRRKTILNSLSHGLGFPKETVQKVLDRLQIPMTHRAERIDISGYVSLAEDFKRVS